MNEVKIKVVIQVRLAKRKTLQSTISTYNYELLFSYCA